MHISVFMLSLNRNVLKKNVLEQGLPKTILAHVQPAVQALRVSPGLSAFFLSLCVHAHTCTLKHRLDLFRDKRGSKHIPDENIYLLFSTLTRCSSRAQLMSPNRPGLDTLYLCAGKALLLLSVEIQARPHPTSFLPIGGTTG